MSPNGKFNQDFDIYIKDQTIVLKAETVKGGMGIVKA